MAKLSYAKIKKALADREEFEGNSMWATYEHSDGAWWGMLPEHDKMFLPVVAGAGAADCWHR